jgi:S-formylglutathione hydrolase FrmB
MISPANAATLALTLRRILWPTPTVLTYQQIYTPDQHGHIELTGIVDVKDFSNVDFQIETTPTVSDPNVLVDVTMGKLSGWTLAVQVDQYPIKDWRQIRSYKVIGPRAFDQDK